MPKVVCNVMGLPLTRTSTGVLQRDSTLVKIVGVIKDIVLKIHKFPFVIFNQEIIIVELLFFLGYVYPIIYKKNRRLSRDELHTLSNSL